MTILKRYLIEMGEILSIRLSCGKCTASLNIPITAPEYVPEACPYCKESWFDKGSTDFQSIAWMIQAVTILKERTANAKCRVELEIEQPNS